MSINPQAVSTGHAIERLVKVRQLLKNGEAQRRRERANLSRSEVAREIGVSPSTVSKWELCERMPSGDTALRYLRVLDRLAKLNQETV